jgi:MerR family transcriptional regulator, thiopeptide resistance regulator
MRIYTISKIARLFGLSRSTLLYYDRVGLLSPSSRTDAGYRMYTEDDVTRLERICILRRTGLSIQDIKSILLSEDNPGADLLEKRLKEVGEEILALKAKQGLLSTMLKRVTLEENRPEVDKQMWVEMLRAAGMDEQAMNRWHSEFEHRAPEAHHKFLLSLGIQEKEALMIRDWSRKVKPTTAPVDHIIPGTGKFNA